MGLASKMGSPIHSQCKTEEFRRKITCFIGISKSRIQFFTVISFFLRFIAQVFCRFISPAEILRRIRFSSSSTSTIQGNLAMNYATRIRRNGVRCLNLHYVKLRCVQSFLMFNLNTGKENIHARDTNSTSWKKRNFAMLTRWIALLVSLFILRNSNKSGFRLFYRTLSVHTGIEQWA